MRSIFRRASAWPGLRRPRTAVSSKSFGHTGHDQRARRLRQLLYCHRCVFDRRAGGECSLWHHLLQSCAAALRNALYQRRGRNQQRPAIPIQVCSAQLVAQQSRPQYQLAHIRADQRHSGIRHSQPHPIYRRVGALNRAPGGPKTVFGASYIGSSSHRQRVLIESNPGNPALCLSLNQPSDVVFGTLTCGAFGEDTVYYPRRRQVNGTRQPLGPNFGSNALQSNIGHANYNSLELSARHTAAGLNSMLPIPIASQWISRRISAKRSTLSILH